MEPQDKPAEGTAGRRRREQLGVVVSASMQKSVVVAVARTVRHATYRKSIKRTSTFMAHDDLGAQKGDTVRIIESRRVTSAENKFLLQRRGHSFQVSRNPGRTPKAALLRKKSGTRS